MSPLFHVAVVGRAVALWTVLLYGQIYICVALVMQLDLYLILLKTITNVHKKCKLASDMQF